MRHFAEFIVISHLNMQKPKNILLIKRAQKHSPNSVDRDTAILRAVADCLTAKGHSVSIANEENLPIEHHADIILSMGRNHATLQWLAEIEESGIPVFNSAKAMLGISRRKLLLTAQEIGVGVPPFAIFSGDKSSNRKSSNCKLTFPVWWKRDDRSSQERGDVVLIHNQEEWQSVMQRGITEYVVEQHSEGDLVKFYSVSGTSFFHWNYPVFSKFGNEAVNGSAQGFHFDEQRLKQQVDLLAQAVGLTIVGGDAIIMADGSFRIIDFNDWPSFSSCREEAAKAITALATPLPCPPPSGRELTPSSIENNK